jgi:hypothetical protein
VRLRRRCADDELVAEVMQETYLAVWRAAASFGAARKPKPDHGAGERRRQRGRLAVDDRRDGRDRLALLVGDA